LNKPGRRGILLVIAGILFVALGIFVVWSLVQNVLTPPVPLTQPSVVTEKVLVTSRGIPLAAVLAPDDLKLVDMPVEFVPRNRMTDTNDAVGKVVNIPMVAGEMILPHHLVDPSNVIDRTLAFSLEDNEVLMAFPVVDLMSRLNILKKGDLVDILVTGEYLVAGGGALLGAEEQETKTYTLDAMQRITISAVVLDVIVAPQPAPTAQIEPEALLTPGAALTPTPLPPPESGRLESAPIALMLALAPQDALVLKHLKDTGAIFDLVLRAPTSTELFDTVPVTSEYLIERFQLQTTILENLP
jgi:pilus assembly protein CpaB